MPGHAGGVDLNRASQAELEKVDGLGAERARRIIERRPLHSWDDLKEIEGFSGTLMHDLRKAGARIGSQDEAA